MLSPAAGSSTLPAPDCACAILCLKHRSPQKTPSQPRHSAEPELAEAAAEEGQEELLNDSAMAAQHDSRNACVFINVCVRIASVIFRILTSAKSFRRSEQKPDPWPHRLAQHPTTSLCSMKRQSIPSKLLPDQSGKVVGGACRLWHT